MAANLGNIVAVQPYDGQQLNSPPQDLVITLDQPFVPLLQGNFDVQLEKVNRDGTMTPIWTVNTAPMEESGRHRPQSSSSRRSNLIRVMVYLT